MAPELLTRAGYDTSADIYSFGVILWELWVKKVPWHHVNSIYIIDRLGKGERPIPKPKKCPDFYSSLIKSSWHQKPAKRMAAQAIFELLRDM
mmetsp:Transcript_27902/g.31014  ORF Transcript_27902/g.31014 Transcript_27902/m.31014 type:complete len:92 (+) Transcript_27902:1313-1588(+)